MDQRISFLTLAVRDLAATRAFYVDGLGWVPEFEDGDEVIMIRAGERLILSLWDRRAFEAEVGAPAGDGVPPITIAHNVATAAEVDQILALAASLGAATSPGQERAWGGYTGYFADPDGFRWEIAMNPSPLGESVLPH
ncbi:VOC family protein [Nocardioides sp.]|uniref:VOC family protein n=1 Tax=Nocardioides sp. TaxID=35761 RepID=UPI00261C26DF|nr:VOC family protein [Nocardioides sp.]